MKDTKQTSILIRLSQEEKKLINETAEKNNKSTNKFLIDLILNNLDDTKEGNDIRSDIKNDTTNDITNDIIELLKNQLATKDEQIHNLQTIIFNRDAKLIELSKKHWWQFWK